MKHFFGALKPTTDVRDYKIAAAAQEFPDSYLCENLPPIKDQGCVSSCVAHATAAILETFNKTETGTFIPLSTNFIYGMQGVALNRAESGMYLRDACKIVNKYGDPSESTIKGNTEQPRCTDILEEQLNEEVYKEASIFKVASYARCSEGSPLRHALMKYGPVLGSIKWYDKYNLKDKIIYFDKSVGYGYHAIMVCGWNEKGWICQNSWGKSWNKDGFFVYPYGEEFSELWSFVDADNEDVYTPKNNSWLNCLYKAINFVINFVKKFIERP